MTLLDLHSKANAVIEQVNQVILGKTDQIRELMLAFLANGHVLLEDIPGVGKTTLALSFAKAMDLEMKRVQFTPDVMPSDLTGFSVFSRQQEQFVYQQGSVFCNLLLADEINRTSPKTQSALLEVMEERKVSVEGVTREVPAPFLVVATQNPYGSAGTQKLPQSQMDRFAISMTLGYPDFQSEVSMAKEIGAGNRVDQVKPVLRADELLEMQAQIHQVMMNDQVYRYLVKLVTNTRLHPFLEQGCSPRATIALVKMAKAHAWLKNRAYVVPADVEYQFPYVAAHRVVPNMAAQMEEKSVMKILAEILRKTKKPPVGAKS